MNNNAKPATDATKLSSINLWVLNAAAIAAIQYAAGAQFDKTGEQISGGLPFATLTLLFCTVTVLTIQKWSTWPIPRMAHVITFALMTLGLCGLYATELRSGIKEIVQLAEVFGLAWLLFRLVPRDQHSALFRGLGRWGLFFVLLGTFHLYRLPPFYLSQARWAGLVVISFPFVLYLLRNSLRGSLLAQILTALLLGKRKIEGEQRQLFERRAASFVVDHERGKVIMVRVGKKAFTMAESGASGYFETAISLDLPADQHA
ncbi:hypothetical protein BVY04_01435, partial [bacterium M21]